MIFTKIEIENYGVFRSRHVFDLKPAESGISSKPIILFGGKNGAGKTTLFEAFRLCLYGSRFQGKKLRRQLYHRYLRQRIHRCTRDVPNICTASVSVEFDYARLGCVDKFLVKRSWECNGTQINESLKIYENSKLLCDIDEEQWHHFLMELIPLGTSKLFFFDGEQIQNLAEDKADNRHLIDSLHSLLGLDLVERLQTDLSIYIRRKAKEENKQLEKEILEYENKEKTLKEQLNSILQDRAQIQNQIDRVQAEIEYQEHQIAKEGGGFANKREELKFLRKRLEEEIDTVKQEIRNLCSGLLPFALVPNLCRSLHKRLQIEEKYQQQTAAKTVLDGTFRAFIREINSDGFWNDFSVSRQDRTELMNRIAETLKRSIRPKKDNYVMQVFHHVSSVERNKLLYWIDKALNQVPPELKKLSIKLEKLTKQRQNVDMTLYRAPPDNVLHPLIQKLGNLHEKLGISQENYRSIDKNVHRVQNTLDLVKHQVAKLLAQEERVRKLSQRLTLARKVQTILDEYIIQLRKEKIKDLRKAFLECFRFLSNKKCLIERIEIDPNDFSITLWNGNQHIFSKKQLAAGEKQIYAVAMLWALARISGRPLPFIIDTPLGRLDSEHRENIVRNFFPHASHQVIVFSTDTEIDQLLFEELQPYISKAYHLLYSEKAGMTRVSAGYFWKSRKKEVIVDAL